MTEARDITALLRAWGDGDTLALDELMPLVHAELRRLARAKLRRERPGHTIQPTALVNEAYLRLVDQRRVRWQNRAHFFGIAAELMRRVLVDHARRRQAAKRGGPLRVVTLDDAVAPVEPRDVELIALDQALERLASFDDRQSRLVVMRFFGGLSVEEAAAALGVSRATAERDWTMARAWLHRTLAGDQGAHEN